MAILIICLAEETFFFFCIKILSSFKRSPVLYHILLKFYQNIQILDLLHLQWCIFLHSCPWILITLLLWFFKSIIKEVSLGYSRHFITLIFFPFQFSLDLLWVLLWIAILVIFFDDTLRVLTHSPFYVVLSQRRWELNREPF